VKKIIILMFGAVLLVGCGADKETTKNNSVEKMIANSRANTEDCKKEQTCQTENCFRCNLKIVNNFTPFNSDSHYRTATNASYEETRYGGIAKTAKKEDAKARQERTKRNQKMAISHRDIAPQRSK
jgi:hypothetical protein